MDGLPALDLWDMVIKVLRSTNNTVQPNHSGIREIGARPNSKAKTQNDKRRHMVEQLSAVDYVPTNTHSSQGKFSCTYFEDNEAVVKMLVKGRSPNNETRVQNPQSCSWLVDRINLVP